MRPALAVGGVILLTLAPRAFPGVEGHRVVRLVVMGDSNSQASFDRTLTRWPERLRAILDRSTASRRPRWQVQNLAWFGMTACDLGREYGGFPLGAPRHLEQLLQRGPLPDVLILAFGTNDVILGTTPGRLLECYRDLRAAAAARGVPSMIALTPHTLTPPYPIDRNAVIDEANRLLRASLPARDLVDFARGMVRHDYMSDGLHIGNAGQRKRTRAALRALRRAPTAGRTSPSSARAALPPV